MTSQWARWRLKSPASRLVIQPFIHAQIIENIKSPRHWALRGEFTRDQWIPRTKGQWRGKCFHLKTSSWGRSLNRLLQFLFWCNFSEWSNPTWPNPYHVHICQVSSQFSRCEICQIWTRCGGFKNYLCESISFLNGEIKGRLVSNPKPCLLPKVEVNWTSV